MNDDVLVDVSCDPLSTDPRCSVAVVRNLRKGVLVDAFGLWDCYRQDWAHPSVTVLRFEADDLMVWRDGDGIRCRNGTVDTNAACASAMLPDVMENAEDPDACLCWVSDESYTGLVGEEDIDQELMEMLMSNL